MKVNKSRTPFPTQSQEDLLISELTEMIYSMSINSDTGNLIGTIARHTGVFTHLE
jgi:hypothetical protein